jgi:ADP-dependent NAD(P)H-hydrate dehydratase / NAD(P)H-hydrate epimerase
MYILSASQIKLLDAHTCKQQSISSVELMGRAGAAFVQAFIELEDALQPVMIFCGTGNNGGDGLVIARLLLQSGYKVNVFVVKQGNKETEEFRINRKRWEQSQAVQLINTVKDIPALDRGSIIIDALLGAGLSRPLEGLSRELVTSINDSGARVIAVDIASGLFCDRDNEDKEGIIRPAYTYTFHAPKLSFLLPQNAVYTGRIRILDIGLDKTYAAALQSPYHWLDEQYMQGVIHQRQKFDHKGTFGHAMLVAGSKGKMGAAILAVRACLRSGAGLTTVQVPACGYEMMQMTCPEAMCLIDEDVELISQVKLLEQEKYSAIGLGPGWGGGVKTVHALYEFLHASPPATCPLVLDADALNILSQHQDWLKKLPPTTILTPHPKEFQRLLGRTWKSDYERLQLLIHFSRIYQVTVILKGAHTCIVTREGKVYFNSTGNPGMAKGGSGDALTGIITALLAQKYTAEEAAILGVYMHGKAADIAAIDMGYIGQLASDIIHHLPAAFHAFEKMQEEKY